MNNENIHFIACHSRDNFQHFNFISPQKITSIYNNYLNEKTNPKVT